MQVLERILGIIVPVFMIIALGCGYACMRGATVQTDMAAINRVSMDVLCPLAGLLVAWLLDQVLPLTAMQRGQMYLFAALPPAVFCFMVAERYQQEPDKVAAIVLLGNLAAIGFVPAGLWLGLR